MHWLGSFERINITHCKIKTECAIALQRSYWGILRLRDNAKSPRHDSQQNLQQEDVDSPTAPKPPQPQETQSRKELGKLFDVTHEALQIWEESGKLKQLGWQRLPYIKSPVKYSRTSQSIAPASALNCVRAVYDCVLDTD